MLKDIFDTEIFLAGKNFDRPINILERFKHMPRSTIVADHFLINTYTYINNVLYLLKLVLLYNLWLIK